jgi:dipeptidyl aminopeptidase/acylaminoacyl peptidase
VRCPVHILQGDADPDVPWQHAMKIYDALQGNDIRITLIKNGDHRLSSPLQLQHLKQAAAALAAQVG